MGDAFTDAAKTDRGRMCLRCKKERGFWAWDYAYCGTCGPEVDKEIDARVREREKRKR
jgi:hypothetical protein